jgi:hypothetical protein
VATSSPRPLAQQPGPCRALPPGPYSPPRLKPTCVGAPRAASPRSSYFLFREHDL